MRVFPDDFNEAIFTPQRQNGFLEVCHAPPTSLSSRKFRTFGATLFHLGPSSESGIQKVPPQAHFKTSFRLISQSVPSIKFPIYYKAVQQYHPNHDLLEQ